MNEEASTSSGLGTKLIAIVLLLVGAWILFKVVIGVVAGIAWLVVIVGAIIAVLWAVSALRS
jgi:hypothetical protein